MHSLAKFFEFCLYRIPWFIFFLIETTWVYKNVFWFKFIQYNEILSYWLKLSRKGETKKKFSELTNKFTKNELLLRIASFSILNYKSSKQKYIEIKWEFSAFAKKYNKFASVVCLDENSNKLHCFNDNNVRR